MYDLTLHCHYHLILDDIGQPLDNFKCSWDMVHAVCATLIGEFFLGGVEVYLSESCTPITHESTYKCRILHCDISPGNILIMSDSNFKGGLLIDWDLSKDMNSQMDRPCHIVHTISIKFLSICQALMNWT